MGVVLDEQAYWEAEHHRAEKEEIKRQADALKRWARLVKGLQIRRRLQAQYQRADTGINLHRDNRDVDVKEKTTSKQQIVVEVSSADPGPGPVLQGSRGVATPEAGGWDSEVHHPRVASSRAAWLRRTDSVFSDFSQVHHDPDLFHAGGFIATADEIVQPFSLPRSQYLRSRDRAPSLPASDDDVEMVPDSEGVVDENPPAANGRSSTKTVEGGRGYEGEGDEGPWEPETTNEPMKTMTELAAEHAERQRQLGLGSTKGSKPSGRGVRSLRARRKAVDDESGDELEVDSDADLSEPSPSDYLSDSPVPNKKRKAVSSTAPSRAKTRSSSKPTPQHRKKRARSPDTDEGFNIEHDGSSRSMSASTGPRPIRKAAMRTAKRESRTIRVVSGSSATSTAVPASDRVLRSRKAKV